MIEFSHVSFSYADRALLKDISFRLEDGQFVGILGPNGGGKSTFLKLALGILKPQSGTLTVTDQVIAYLSQTSGRDDHDFQCTVEELVGMGLIGRNKWFLNRDYKRKSKRLFTVSIYIPCARNCSANYPEVNCSGHGLPKPSSPTPL